MDITAIGIRYGRYGILLSQTSSNYFRVQYEGRVIEFFDKEEAIAYAEAAFCFQLSGRIRQRRKRSEQKVDWIKDGF